MKFQWEKKSFFLGVLVGAVVIAFLYFSMGLFRTPPPQFHGGEPGDFSRDATPEGGMRDGQGGGRGMRNLPPNP